MLNVKQTDRAGDSPLLSPPTLPHHLSQNLLRHLPVLCPARNDLQLVSVGQRFVPTKELTRCLLLQQYQRLRLFCRTAWGSADRDAMFLLLYNVCSI